MAIRGSPAKGVVGLNRARVRIPPSAPRGRKVYFAATFFYGFEKLKKIIAEVLNVDEEEITMDTTFVDDLGADSLDIFQIIMGIEEEFDIEIANEDAEHIVTVADAVELIKNALN